jgi:hypothetical protein
MNTNQKLSEYLNEKDPKDIARAMDALLNIVLDPDLVKARGTDLGPNEVRGLEIIRNISRIASKQS